MESTGNAFSRRKNQNLFADKVVGGRIIVEGAKISRRLKGGDVIKGKALVKELSNTTKETSMDTDTDTDTPATKMHVLGSKVKPVSLSGDVIFTPYTDGTQYACRRDATANLQRRMPGYEIMISDVSGDGQVDFTIEKEVSVEKVNLTIIAQGIASMYEMALSSIELSFDKSTVTITPTTVARSPEDTVLVINRIVKNVIAGKPAEDSMEVS